MPRIRPVIPATLMMAPDALLPGMVGSTIYSAIIREIATKGPEARFRKSERGKFAHV
jgi:hypothetical protein